MSAPARTRRSLRQTTLGNKTQRANKKAADDTDQDLDRAVAVSETSAVLFFEFLRQHMTH
jgi:hypothetical protein